MLKELERLAHSHSKSPIIEEQTERTSFCESEQELNDLGMIRATTYKKQFEMGPDSDSSRLNSIDPGAVRYKSEEKTSKKLFSQEYLDQRYVNPKVELELKDFMAQIEKKFKESELATFVFPRQPAEPKKTN